MRCVLTILQGIEIAAFFWKKLQLIDKWEFVGGSVGARDFSPDWKHRYFGSEVPCPDNDKYQFIEHPWAFSEA